MLRYGLDSQGIVGLTVLGAQRILDDEGELRVTLLETRSDDPLIALDEMPAGSPLISLAEIKREFGIE